MMFNLQNMLVISLIVLLTACGNPPLIAPERTENIAQSEQAVQAKPPTTFAIVGGSANSPLAPPTASVEPTSSPTSPEGHPSETPVPTVTPSLATQTPHPTQKPSPPISTVVSPGIPIKEYIFGTPEELQDLDDSMIKEWVPGSAEEMIVMGDDFLDTINILTGKKQRLAEWNAEIRFVTDNLVWLQSAKAVALILGNLETKQYELWISTLGKETAKQANLTNVERSFIPIGTDTGLGVYDLESKTLMSVADDGRVLPTKATSLQATPTMPGALPYKVTQRGDWVAYYNRDNFLMVNLETNEIKNINFTDEQGHSLSAWDAQWNSDSSKLALLVSQRNPTLTFMDLYVYDVVTDKLQKIQNPFTNFIDSVAWGSDNRHVVVNAIIGEAEYQTLSNGPLVSDAKALFLVDTITTEYSPISIHSPDIASSIGQVLWSLDGKYLIARYRFYEGGIHTYRIEVKPQ